MKNNSIKKILKKGEVINGTYTVEFFIGQGAFGEVYRVKHKFFEKYQVMKVFKCEYVENADLDEVINEGRILAKLSHPNVVRVFEINTFSKNDKQHFFITMIFVSGESLAQLLRRKIQLPVPAAISIMADVLSGLNAAHQNKPTIIHRDINPDNILLSYDSDKPVGLLGDFGLARSLDEDSKLAGAGGRYLYFAPECFLDCYLPSSDVFSAGVVFYRMLTGIHPWKYDFDHYKLNDNDQIAKMVNSGRKVTPQRPSLFNEEIDDKLEKVIIKSIEKNMENRYRTAGAFLEGLKEVCQADKLTDNYWSEHKLYPTH